MKRRGRRKNTFYKRYHKRIKNLIDNFMESERAEAYIGRAILAMVGLGAILVVGAMAPNIFSAFGKLGKAHHFDERQIRASVYYLRKRGLVKFIKKKSDNVCEIRITKKGKTSLAEFAIENLKINQPERWDGRWRVAIFDIPERYDDSRDSLRRKFKALGLFQLQRSVFIHPYPIEDEVLFIAAFFDVEKYLEILTVDSMLDDRGLRRHFEI